MYDAGKKRGGMHGLATVAGLTNPPDDAKARAALPKSTENAPARREIRGRDFSRICSAKAKAWQKKLPSCMHYPGYPTGTRKAHGHMVREGRNTWLCRVKTLVARSGLDTFFLGFFILFCLWHCSTSKPFARQDPRTNPALTSQLTTQK